MFSVPLVSDDKPLFVTILQPTDLHFTFYYIQPLGPRATENRKRYLLNTTTSILGRESEVWPAYKTHFLLLGPMVYFEEISKKT